MVERSKLTRSLGVAVVDPRYGGRILGCLNATLCFGLSKKPLRMVINYTGFPPPVG